MNNVFFSNKNDAYYTQQKRSTLKLDFFVNFFYRKKLNTKEYFTKFETLTFLDIFVLVEYG